MARRIGIHAALALALVGTLAAGCGDDDDPEVSDTSSTTASTATTVSDGTTTSEGPTTTTGGDLADEPPIDQEGPSGSGCSPGAGDLPDGWWYGTFHSPVGATVEFDLACYYVGAAAEEEAASRGDEVNNDYYVVNDNESLRTVPLASGATAECVELEANLEMVECAPDETDPMWAKWIRVQDGEIDRIVEQYAP